MTYGEIECFAGMIDSEIQQIKKLDRITEALSYTKGIVQYSNENLIDVLQLREIGSHFDALIRFVEMVEQKCSDAGRNPFTLFYAYNDIENEIEMLDNANRSDDFVFDMLLNQLKIRRDRNNRQININKAQLQKMFHLLIEKFGSTDDQKYYIYLDEFQDYSVEELTDIRRYMRNAVISLYGDVKQCINTSGIKETRDVHKAITFDGEYELKENYRNSSEITQYVNDRFGMDMYKIGLPGSVQESTRLVLNKLESNDRAAIIVADESLFATIKESTDGTEDCYYNDEGIIHKNRYNVLTVSQSKGLEFERVIVLEKNMTQNQLYVACTRAIRDLNVVKLS